MEMDCVRYPTTLESQKLNEYVPKEGGRSKQRKGPQRTAKDLTMHYDRFRKRKRGICQAVGAHKIFENFESFLKNLSEKSRRSL